MASVEQSLWIIVVYSLLAVSKEWVHVLHMEILYCFAYTDSWTWYHWKANEVMETMNIIITSLIGGITSCLDASDIGFCFAIYCTLFPLFLLFFALHLENWCWQTLCVLLAVCLPPLNQVYINIFLRISKNDHSILPVKTIGRLWLSRWGYTSCTA